MITRRTFIKGAATAGVAAIGLPEMLASRGKHSEAKPADAMQALRIPPIITGGDLTLAAGTFQVYPDAPTNLFMVNGQFPAPTIKLKKGDTFQATVHNNLTEHSVLHWHGVFAPAAMGGHPASVVDPGTSYSVNFPIVQRASINFYHAHPHMMTGEQVYRGLAGFFLIEDDVEQGLGLPSGDFDVPLLIQDKRVDANRQFIYSLTNADMMSGWLGETILINGTPNPYLDVAPTLYRFRIVNGSNARFYTVALSDNSAFTVIGNDGGFLDAPIRLTSVGLAPAERLDLLVDFSSRAQGDTMTLVSQPFTMSDPPGTGTVPQGAALDLLQFRVNRTGSSGGSIPTSLPAIPVLKASDAKRTRLWTFSAMHYINDLSYDLARVDATVPFGDLEEWTFQSVGNTHPVHIHGAQFQVLDRNGNLPEPYERGWKDVIRLDPQGTVHVLVPFNMYPGLFVIHCHKLEHADEGMMSNFAIGESSVAESTTDEVGIQIVPNPASDHTLISFPSLKRKEMIEIQDEKGAIIFSKVLPLGTTQITVQTNAFADGNYMIMIGNRMAALTILRASK